MNTAPVPADPHSCYPKGKHTEAQFPPTYTSVTVDYMPLQQRDGEQVWQQWQYLDLLTAWGGVPQSVTLHAYEEETQQWHTCPCFSLLFHRYTCTQTSHRILTLFGLSGRDYNRFSHLGFSHCRIPGEVFLTRSQPASLSLPRIVKIMLIIIVIIEKIYSVSLTTDTDCHKRHYWVCGRNSQATTVEAPLWIDVLQSFKYLIQI